MSADSNNKIVSLAAQRFVRKIRACEDQLKALTAPLVGISEQMREIRARYPIWPKKEEAKKPKLTLVK